MKLITYEVPGGVLKLGALREDREDLIIDLAAGALNLGLKDGGILVSMLSLIEAGANGIQLANEVVDAAKK